MTKELIALSNKDSPLVRALSRWENEGGKTDAYWERCAAHGNEQKQIFQYLEATAFISLKNIPTDISEIGFRDSAVSISWPLEMTEMKERIAHFLHGHKNL